MEESMTQETTYTIKTDSPYADSLVNSQLPSDSDGKV